MEVVYSLNSTGQLLVYLNPSLPTSPTVELIHNAQDAAFLLPQTTHGPLHCSSPHDIYLLLKSSDFLTHSLEPSRAYEAVTDQDHIPAKEDLKVELVLRRYENVNPSREFRCFVRNDMLIGSSLHRFHYTP